MDLNNVKMREFIYSLIDVKPAMSVLDLGCGTGYDLGRIAQIVDEDSLLYGIDSMENSILRAKSQYHSDPRMKFTHDNIEGKLGFAGNSFDVVLSNNVLECITDKQSLIAEVHRVLKPNGQAIFAHFDWDSQLIDGEDKELVRRIVHTFSDWKQEWMSDIDAWMGRRLWRTFQQSGLFRNGRIETYVLTNTEYSEPFYGYQRIQDFGSLVKRNMISEDDYTRFLADIQQLASGDGYFYSINMYVYVGLK
ncbi:MAG: methyltransferase domain-containing protein [Firmicutes bacterium]|nr:methyltransferase domain-containing protein [Bacillota bacterium]